MALQNLCAGNPATLEALDLNSPMASAAALHDDLPAVRGLQREADRLWELLQQDKKQKRCTERILASIKAGKGGRFFINGRAGTGKTTLANYLTAAMELQHPTATVLQWDEVPMAKRTC